MTRFIFTLASFVFMAWSAQAAEMQWATACTSFTNKDVLSVSYNTQSGQITIYRARIPDQRSHVTRYTAAELTPKNYPTLFRSETGSGESDAAVEFQTKSTIRFTEGAHSADYFCEYYRIGE
ncbi:hypothetical protein [Bdellovibrio sp. HCB337]|uniref:hypothetical protein n=1 Tax=Bdellovibrio sp. HCB337 TaxID=3394358 RepID=UPI0039A4C97A